MANITAIPGIAELMRQTRVDPRVCVAVLDGPVDLDHPCFAGADLTPLATLASGRATGGGMSRHGTHVASVIFGRHDGPVPGLAPGCRGLIVPIFTDEEGHLWQRDRAAPSTRRSRRGRTSSTSAAGRRSLPARQGISCPGATRHARDQNVLIVAAAGNDGCACLHFPAAVACIAVGRLDHFTTVSEDRS